MKAWKHLQQEGFYNQKFEEMSPILVAETVFNASKLSVQNDLFWQRAAYAVSDVVKSLNNKHLTSVCHAFGAVAWRDATLANHLAHAVAAKALTLRPSDLATIVQSFARSKFQGRAALQSLSSAVEMNGKLNSKGWSIVLESFTSLRLRHAGVQCKLTRWVVDGGLEDCEPEHFVILLRALSILTVQESISLDVSVALSTVLARFADALEPPLLVSATLAASRLSLAEPLLVERLEVAVHDELHRLHSPALSPLLEAFAHLYKAPLPAASVDTPSPLAASPKRQQFIAHITGRLTRHLRFMRPQDACRALQALDRLDVIDPLLLSATKSLVPARLAAWPAPEIQRLLQAYAAAGNSDGFMVSCLRKALLPTVSQGADACDGFIDSAMLTQVSDLDVVSIASAFAVLSHSDAVLCIILALKHPVGSRPRELNATCVFALAQSVLACFPSPESWETGVSALARALPEIAGRACPLLNLAEYAVWCNHACLASVDIDDLLLAVGSLPEHPQRTQWVAALSASVSHCNVALLPALLLIEKPREHAVVDDHLLAFEALQMSAEHALVRSALEGGLDATHGIVPQSATVAALRALAHRAKQRGVQDLEMLRRAVEVLATSVEESVARDGAAGDSKAVVRALQALQALHVEPAPSLVMLFVTHSMKLTSSEFLAALRSLTSRSVHDSNSASALSTMATRVMATLKSARQAWELQGLCTRLGLEVGEVGAPVREDDSTMARPSQSP